LEESEIIENKDHDDCLQELAMNNTTLESLSLYLTEVNVRVDDLVLLAIFYPNLVYVKITDESCDILDLQEFSTMQLP